MTSFERFETIARAYINASDEARAAVLELIPEEDRKTFLEGVGLYHLMHDEAFFRAACREMGERIYNELH